MKVVILAGGLGTRLSEETGLRPKPMVGIGGHPILWHIMKIYAHYGFKEFVVLCGYKSEVIKDYFVNYYMNNSDVTVDLATNHVEIHQNISEPWKVTMFYTGKYTQTGGRIRKIKDFIGNEPFLLTYGDGVADVDISAVVASHQESKKLATLTSIQPNGRFGSLEIEEDGKVLSFQEKPKGEGGWINGGFFVLQPEIFDYIPDREDAIWEQEPLKQLASEGQLNAYMHHGFWHCMDTLKDKDELNKMWAENKAPWKVWE
jgi:glucose-1-phosphate cytidylyltransferase